MYSREMQCLKIEANFQQKNSMKRCGRHSRVFFSSSCYFTGPVRFRYELLMLRCRPASSARAQKPSQHWTLVRLTIPIKIRTKQIHVVPFFNIDRNGGRKKISLNENNLLFSIFTFDAMNGTRIVFITHNPMVSADKWTTQPKKRNKKNENRTIAMNKYF